MFLGGLVAAAAIARTGTASPVVYAALWLVIFGPIVFFGERSGVFSGPDGLRVVPISGKSLQLDWTEIEGFEVAPLSNRYAVFAKVSGGSVALSPTQGWAFQRREVERLCAALNDELRAATAAR